MLFFPNENMENPSEVDDIHAYLRIAHLGELTG